MVVFNLFGDKKAPHSTAMAENAKAQQPDAISKEGWLLRLKRGLGKTSILLNADLIELLSHKAIDEAFYGALETLLISADVGIRATEIILQDLRRSIREKQITDPKNLRSELKKVLLNIMRPLEQPLDTSRTKPFVILIVGVNGVGKTTTIGKLARYFQSEGKSVMLAAGDTFRAAAREQLLSWGERNNVTVVSQEGGDSAAVIFDAIQSAKARDIDVILADTAGRLPTQLHLMDEITKIRRVIGKADPGAPHETLLVVDANTGQNAISQVRSFDRALQLTGLIVTKLDGTAKGGVVAALACELDDRMIPVRFVGVGEALDDLRPFVVAEFVDALFE